MFSHLGSRLYFPVEFKNTQDLISLLSFLLYIVMFGLGYVCTSFM